MRKICILFGIICAVLYAGTEYDFYMISDTHFGTLQSFGENPPSKLLRKGQRADAVLPLYSAFFASMRNSMDEKTAFIIHGGDLIEGNAHDKDSQIKQFTEARKLLKDYFACPIYMVRGNHEAAGLHGGEVYKLPQQLRKWQENPLTRCITQSTMWMIFSYFWMLMQMDG